MSNTSTDDTMASSPAIPSHPLPNFTASKSITLPYRLERVFSTLATSGSLEPVARLSNLVTSFILGDTEPIAISPGTLSLARGTPQLPSSSSPDSLCRTKFVMEETISILGGLFKTRLRIEGSQTEDHDHHCCLYESVAQRMGIIIWKLREFEEVEVDGQSGTKVTERIEGRCPGWIRWLVERDCRSAHTAHMEAYHTLFD